MPRYSPLISPLFSIASYMYTEQVGSNRHIGGSSGETYRLYPHSSASIKAFTGALPTPRPPAALCVRAALSPAGLRRCNKEIVTQHAVSGPGTALPGIYDKIKTVRDFSVRLAENLPEQAFDPVPDHGVPDFSRDRDSKAMMAKSVLPAEEHKPPSLCPPPLTVYGTIVDATHDSKAPRKPFRMRAIHSLSAFCAPWRGGVSAQGARLLSPCGP